MNKPSDPAFLPGLLYGGDYNPEQWPESVWEEDRRLMRLAHVNTVSVPVFGWATLQPDEDTYDFAWLDRVLDGLAAIGVRACLATATASQPAWLDRKYPETLVADESGRRRRHGNRHSFCPNAPDFRRLADALVTRLAERYRDHPALLLWHVSNEYGTYCWCDTCAAVFRQWLRGRYGSLEALNDRWVTRFWGHTYTAWEEIEPPYSCGEGSVQALRLDWQRFQSESLLNCYRAEAAILRRITPGIPITTNLMGAFFPLNYRKWAAELDIVSWDNYPVPHDPPATVAFNHALMRGIKDGEPFLLLEQSPSQQNWQPYNGLKAPGVLRLQSYQAVAHGADSVMYFQWRRSRGGIEKLHGAIVEHHADPSARVFQEVAALGAELERLGGATLGGRTPARVAVLFDWESWWALRFSSGPSVDLDYVRECRAAWSALHALGISTELAAPNADLARFDLIVAPTLSLLTEENGRRIEERVAAGATLLATPFTGLTDDCDRVHPGGPPGPLRRALGLFVEETDALPKGKVNGIRLDTGETLRAEVLCERLRLEGATAIGIYADDFYAGEPALTVHAFGKGRAHYLAACLDAAGWRTLLARLCAEAGIGSPLADGAAPPEGVEAAVRVTPDGRTLLFLLHHGARPADVALPAGDRYTDLITGGAVAGTTTLAPRDVRILSREAST